MIKYLLIIGSALAIVLILVPSVKKRAVQWGFIDQPSERKVHKIPLPRLGGVAIYLGCVATLVLFDVFYISQLVSIVLGATFVSFLGIWDDYRRLRPIVKFGGQVLASLILVLAGVKVSLPMWEVLNVGLTVLWVVTITNSLNLLDNMDGLSGGIAMVICTFFLLLAIISRQYLVASLSAALLGACLGFLYYNFNPASIFMGDSGSLFIGFLLAVLGIKLRFPSNTPFVTWMIPVVLLGLPLFDTTLVVLSRLRRRLNPFTTPGKDHVSHRLVKRGATHREAVLTLYLVCCALGVIAIFLVHASKAEAYTMLALLVATGLIALWRLERVPI
jgi:UDP-GlcNAc:undecaprenyl-phosphate/decaprenyl-phosphate GlcNAc-1-phosphate transferase